MPHTQQVRLAHELRMACIRITRKVRYEASQIPPHHLTALAAVERAELTASDLAAREQVSAASMSRTIKELCDRELITRSPHPHDGRQLLISLTPAGRRILDEGRRQRDSWMCQRLDRCTDDERAVLAQAAQILNRMVCEVSR